MGQQLYITRKDMEAAGASYIGQKQVDEWGYDADGYETIIGTIHLARYEIPNLGTWTSYVDDDFCVDCNAWGSNYPCIMSWVESNNIPHTLGQITWNTEHYSFHIEVEHG